MSTRSLWGVLAQPTPNVHPDPAGQESAVRPLLGPARVIRRGPLGGDADGYRHAGGMDGHGVDTQPYAECPSAFHLDPSVLAGSAASDLGVPRSTQVSHGLIPLLSP